VEWYTPPLIFSDKESIPMNETAIEAMENAIKEIESVVRGLPEECPVIGSKGDYRDIKKYYKQTVNNLENAIVALGKMAIVYRDDDNDEKAVIVDTLAYSVHVVKESLESFYVDVM